MTTSLRRTLGFTDLVLLTLGTVIGSGIFLVPGVVLKQTQGSLGVALLVWIVGGTFLGLLKVIVEREDPRFEGDKVIYRS